MASPITEISGIRERFPVTRNLVYLNHAAVSPLPEDAVRAVNAYLEDIRDYGSMHESRWLGVIEEVREKYARLINALPTEIAFLKSPLSGIQLVSQGLELKEGDKVVTADVEFPANIYPWMSMVPKGVEVKFVGPREGRIDFLDVERAIDQKTKIVAVSLVEFGNGCLNRVEELAAICRRKGVFFFLDATQGVGAIPFDAMESGADFVMVGTYKWLMGPQGMGMFYCRSEVTERLKYEGLSWRSLAQEEDVSGARISPKVDARRFESEQPTFMGIIGLGGSLSLREEIGNHIIFSRVRMLADRLVSGLAGAGYTVHTPEDSDERAGIIVFAHPELDCKDIAAKLRRDGIIVCARNGTVRASPHFYNSEGEIDTLLKLLPQ
jgi:selenocysteine lyase/cysteine desulfurase